jgi:hypothetical protein
VDKHFFFVFPYYLEGSSEWGILRKDLTVYPAYVALANLTNTLGTGRYLGKLAGVPEAVESFVFDTGFGKVAVLWSEQELTWQPEEFASARNILGQQIASDLAVGPDPIFLLGVDELVPQGDEQELTSPDPKGQSRLVPVLECNLDYNREQGGYASMGTEEFSVTLTLYNFGQEAFQAEASLALPQAWQVSPQKQVVRAEAGKAATCTFLVNPHEAVEEEVLIHSLIQAPGEQISQSRVMIFPAGLFTAEAPYLQEKIQIDGDLAEWSRKPIQVREPAIEAL